MVPRIKQSSFQWILHEGDEILVKPGMALAGVQDGGTSALSPLITQMDRDTEQVFSGSERTDFCKALTHMIKKKRVYENSREAVKGRI